VLSGRLKAVLVATLATIILVGVIGPATTLASNPPGLARFMYAVGRVESGGDYYARNASSGAYGKYQIIPSSWRAWAGRYLGDPYAKPTPANQEIVAAAKFRALYNWLGSWRRVAYSWLTGSSRTSGWSYYATRYVNRVMGYYYSTTIRDLAAVANPLRRYTEKSASIAYSGSWRSARYWRYAGGAVKYATAARATATFTFTGTRLIWYGPVGPTRGRAKIRIDGAYVKTVDLHSTSFTARKAIFSTSWATAGRHTLVIEVVGTAGHPYVAIDELAVAN
jgi:Transglycosylase-like domain./Hox9 activation region.